MDSPRTAHSQLTDSSSALSSNQTTTISSLGRSAHSDDLGGSQSAFSNTTSGIDYADSATVFLQQKLRERKVALQREGRLTEDTKKDDVRPLENVANKHERTTSERTPRYKRAGQMGLREQEEHVSKLDKKNFDLKLRIYHQDKRLDELLVELEKRDADRNKMMKLVEDQQQELERKDESLKQAVDTILIMDDKINRIERLLQEKGLQDSEPATSADTASKAIVIPSSPQAKDPIRSVRQLRNSFAPSDNSPERSNFNLVTARTSHLHLRAASIASHFTEDSRFALDRLATKSPAFSILSEGDLESVYAWKEERRRQATSDGRNGRDMDSAVADSEDEDEEQAFSDTEAHTLPASQTTANATPSKELHQSTPVNNHTPHIAGPSTVHHTPPLAPSIAYHYQDVEASSTSRSSRVRPPPSPTPASKTALTPPTQRIRTIPGNYTTPTTPHSAALPSRSQPLSTTSSPQQEPPLSAPPANGEKRTLLQSSESPLSKVPPMATSGVPRLTSAPRSRPLPPIPNIYTDSVHHTRMSANPVDSDNVTSPTPHTFTTSAARVPSTHLHTGRDHVPRHRRSLSLSAKEEQLLKYIEGIDGEFYIRGPKEMMLAAGMFGPEYSSSAYESRGGIKFPQPGDIENIPQHENEPSSNEGVSRRDRPSASRCVTYSGAYPAEAPPDTHASAAFSRRGPSVRLARRVEFASEVDMQNVDAGGMDDATESASRQTRAAELMSFFTRAASQKASSGQRGTLQQPTEEAAGEKEAGVGQRRRRWSFKGFGNAGKEKK